MHDVLCLSKTCTVYTLNNFSTLMSMREFSFWYFLITFLNSITYNVRDNIRGCVHVVIQQIFVLYEMNFKTSQCEWWL